MRATRLLRFALMIAILNPLVATAQITNESPPPGYPAKGCDYDQRGNYYCWGGNNNTASVDKFAAIAFSLSTAHLGIGHGLNSRAEAEQLALSICGKTASDCKIVQWGVNTCIAFALSKAEGSWGTGIAGKRELAVNGALGLCRAAKGKGCIVDYAPCANDDSRFPAPPPLVRHPNDDPIVGCYQWFNGGVVVIRQDHAVIGGPFTANWQVSNAAQRAYVITWPQPVLTDVALSPDQKSLSGKNQYLGAETATRIVGTTGLIGTWNWFFMLPGKVTINSDGTFSGVVPNSTWHGTWQATKGSPGAYRLTGEQPKDKITLTANGSRISGANQYGIAVSGVRSDSCR